MYCEPCQNTNYDSVYLKEKMDCSVKSGAKKVTAENACLHPSDEKPFQKFKTFEKVVAANTADEPD